jgi:hypothetical protein
MNGQQKAVLWIGLLLIGLNLVMKWKQISAIIFTGAGQPAPPNTSSGGGGGIKLPFPTWPGTNIPIL